MSEQFTLFATSGAPEPGMPLAARLRPRTFDELVGQKRAVAILRPLAEAGRLPSVLLWGPPGSGKTTLAGILSRTLDAHHVELSAVTAGVADLRRVIAEARQARRTGRRTVLFIDELHRFNKAQQDAVLPHVEDGTVLLIGATTENPSFEVIAPLLSRTRVFRVEALTEAEMVQVIDRGLGELGSSASPEVKAALAQGSRGDARVALNGLETAHGLAGEKSITLENIREALQESHLLYDRGGDQHYDIASALIKSIRGSDADAAVYWLARMLEAGEDLNFIARRLVILASEDIGPADPQSLVVAVAAQQAAHLVGLPEARLTLTQATLHLALAPKSDLVKRAYMAAADTVARTGNLPVPPHLRNSSPAQRRRLGFADSGASYRSPHEHPGAAADQEYLPAELEQERRRPDPAAG